MIGQTIGSYRIDNKRGEGGMGVFYRATDVNLERVVGLKTLRPEYEEDQTFRARLLREAKVLARLNHPNIASLLQYLEEGSRICLIVEFVEGSDLGEILNREGPLPPGRAIKYMIEILDALAYAHRQGVVHRDIKPSNVLINLDDQVKVTDFGIAKLRDAKKLTQTGSGIGSYLYMSPEQIEGGETDGRTDLYAAGVTLFEITTGQVPFNSESEYRLMTMVMSEPPPAPSQVNPQIPSELDAIVFKAMAKNPDDRFADATEFKEALRRVGILSAAAAPQPARDTGSPTVAPTPRQVSKKKEDSDRPGLRDQQTRVGPRPGSKRKLGIIAGIVGVVLLALAGWYFTKGPGEEGIPTQITDVDTMTSQEDTASQAPIETASSVLAQAEQAERAGNSQEALRLYRRVLQLDPSMHSASNAIARLESPPSGNSTLRFSIQPLNRSNDLQSLAVDGNPVEGPPWSVSVEAGRHTIRYRTTDGVFTDTMSIGNEDRDVYLNLGGGAGRLNVAAINLPGGPTFAEIYIDGQRIEKVTPARIDDIAAGPHEVEVRHSVGGSRKTIVQMLPPVTRIEFDFNR